MSSRLLCWSQNTFLLDQRTTFSDQSKYGKLGCSSLSTSICLRRATVTFIGTFVYRSPLIDSFFVIYNWKLGDPKLQHIFSFPEWKIYRVSLEALRQEASSDVGRDKGHSFLTQQSTSPRRELSTISYILCSTDTIMHVTYIFPDNVDFCLHIYNFLMT